MSRRSVWQAGLAVLLAMGLVLWQTTSLVQSAALADVRAGAQRSLERYSTNLQALLETYGVLPRLLARSDYVAKLLLAPENAALRDEANTRLAEFNADARATDTYMIDVEGRTLAASNAASKTSFVGMSFAFRPYFQSALAGGDGLYFALGTTSNRPGFYFSHPVKRSDTVIGVCVVKISQEQLENTWSQTALPVIVTDSEGVVFITNREDLRYRTLRPLTAEAHARIRATRQYVDQPLAPLPVVGEGWVDGPARSLTLREPVTGGEPSRDIRYLVETAQVTETGWVVHVLAPLAPVQERVSLALVIAASGCAVALLLGLYWWQRRLRLRERLHYQARVADTLRRARDELERRVTERTRELQRAQDELIQASKMAALGQLSAGLVHELNQPLAAIRGYADNATILLERARYDAAADNLGIIVELTDRMAVLTSQLRSFARKTSDEIEPVDLARAIHNAVTLIDPRLRRDGTELTLTLPPATVWIRGNAIRLEQVLVNLLKNACDAMNDATRRQIEITLQADGAQARIAVRDTGPGIAPDALDRLFDPFFTTKPVGEGLGLGLSISYGIVDAFGGTLRATHHPDGGAVFTVELPQAPPP